MGVGVTGSTKLQKTLLIRKTMFLGQGYSGKTPENTSVHGALQVGLGGVQAVHLVGIKKRFSTTSIKVSEPVFCDFLPT